MQTTNVGTGALEWQLFKKAGEPSKVAKDSPQSGESESARRIRCPRCQWQPDASSRWVCENGDGPEPPFGACGTSWNTFATRGRCPGCAHQWQWTSCLRCDDWSPHDEWYDERG